MNKILFCDVDGVLLDYNQAYLVLWNKCFPRNSKYLVDPNAYSYHAAYDIPVLDQESAELSKLICAKDPDFWREMQPIYGAREMLEAAKEIGYTIICVSAAQPYTTEYRRKNLNTHFPGLISDVVCLGHGNKSKFVDNYKNPNGISVIIDDYFPYLQDVRKTTTILYNRNSKAIDNPNKNAYNVNIRESLNDIIYTLEALGDGVSLN